MICKCLYLRIAAAQLLLLVAGQSFGQTVAWDSTVRPDIYAPRVALTRSFKHSPKDIIFLGNSITFWAEWQELLGNKHIRNRGIPGDTSYGILGRLDEVTGGKPAKVFLMIGINDLARNTPAAVVANNCKRIVKRIKTESPRTRVYLQSLLPTNDSFNKLPNHCNKDALILEVNGALAVLAKEENVGFIDLYTHFSDSAGKLKKELTWDGVHLTAAGYAQWADLLRKGQYINSKR